MCVCARVRTFMYPCPSAFAFLLTDLSPCRMGSESRLSAAAIAAAIAAAAADECCV